MRMFGMWIGLMRMPMVMMMVVGMRVVVVVIVMMVTIKPTCAATETIAQFTIFDIAARS